MTSPICPICDTETDGFASLPTSDGGRVHVACQLKKYEAEAHALGVEAAKSAASWCTNGNTSEEHYRRVLALMDDGDPRVEEYLPAYPDLSGEWADSPTPISLYEEVTGLDHSEAQEAAGLGYETLVGSVVDAIANAWEEGVSETFELECERLMREAIGPSDTLILPDGTTHKGRLQMDDDGRPIVDLATCGVCGFTWNDALITGITPTPSGRCPNEYGHNHDA